MNKIPKTFNILGHIVTVKLVDVVPFEDPKHEGSWGCWIAKENTIYVKKQKNKEIEIHTFLHELVHCILAYMNESKLNDNEKFVDLFGGMLHQILKTSKY